MKALVTGAAGFIGANLVRHLLRAGEEPVAVVRDDRPRWRLQDISDEISIRRGDLCDRDTLRRIVLQVRPEVIFHLAAHGAYSWQTDLDAMLDVNVRATETLLDAGRRIEARIVSAGSSSEYGIKDHPPTETEAVAPNSLYAVTKACATHLCRLAAATYDQHAVTLRFYSIYGPWEEPGRLIPTLVERGLAGQLPPLVGPDTARDFVWVEDACEALVLAATTELGDPGAVLNIASGTQITLARVVEMIRELFAIDAEPRWGTMQQRSWDTTVWVGTPAAARESLGWQALTPLRAGVQMVSDWVQSDPLLLARYAPA